MTRDRTRERGREIWLFLFDDRCLKIIITDKTDRITNRFQCFLENKKEETNRFVDILTKKNIR